MTRIIVIVLLLIGSSLIAEDKKPAVDPNLTGQWEITSATYNGSEAAQAAGAQLAFADGELKALKDGKEVRTLKFTLDPKANPKRIDMTRDDGKSAPGIYTIEKDELKLCYRDYGETDAGPPKKFESKEGDKVFLLVLKRVK
jgi:uncharacterized protein (TIGR03067 family)